MIQPEDITASIIHVMHENAMHLTRKIIAPNTFVVFLREADYSRIEKVSQAFLDDTRETLQEELERLNRELKTGQATDGWGWVRAILRFISGKTFKRRPIKNIGQHWFIELQRDIDNRIPPERPFLVVANFDEEKPPNPNSIYGTLPVSADLIHTLSTHDALRHANGSAGKLPLEKETGTPVRTLDTLARILYTTSDGRTKKADIKPGQNPFRIGRGGPRHDVHLRVPVDTDVSREHCYIRYTESGFEIQDVSSNGTWVNGEKLPGPDTRSESSWTSLPDKASINLANLFTLDFEIL